MNPRLWLPPLVFVATAVPTVLALHRLDVGGDLRIVIAIVVGGIATAVVQRRLTRRDDPTDSGEGSP